MGWVSGWLAGLVVGCADPGWLSQESFQNAVLFEDFSRFGCTGRKQVSNLVRDHQSFSSFP